MIYWTNENIDDDLSTITWYAYTKDFCTLTTNPKLLFKPKSNLAGIDGDITEKDGKYYLFVADEGKDAICYAVADKPNGPYFEPDNNKISVASVALEGNCTYKILSENKYVLIADQFRNGGYFMQESEDLLNWKPVDKSKISLDHLRPRHGSMLHITDEELKRLTEYYK